MNPNYKINKKYTQKLFLPSIPKHSPKLRKEHIPIETFKLRPLSHMISAVEQILKTSPSRK